MGPSTGGTVLKVTSDDFVDSKHTDLFCRFGDLMVPARLDEKGSSTVTCVAPPASQLVGRRLVRRRRPMPTHRVALSGAALFDLALEEIVASTQWVVNRWLTLPSGCARK